MYRLRSTFWGFVLSTTNGCCVLDARFYQAGLTAACFEHVQIDTDMRIEETLLEKV